VPSAALAIGALAAAVLAAIVVPPLLRRGRRRRSLELGLPPSWQALADRAVPARAHWPATLRKRHDGLIRALLEEKAFVGCNGFEITEDVRLTIAAQATLLLLGRPGRLYDELLSILVYPTAFWVEDEVHDDDGLITRRRRVLSGETWESQRLILSWEDIEESLGAPPDGFNVVLHECAHYLEAEGGGLATSGRERVRTIDAWSAELTVEFASFRASVDCGEDTFLDPYAAEDVSEFFAVATEEFFERPRELLAHHPRLYGLLEEFYAVNPGTWVGPPKR